MASDVMQMQSRIIDLWCATLGTKHSDLKPMDDFFALGGDSLRAAQMVSRLNREHAIDIELTDLFESSDLEGFSELVWSKLQKCAEPGALRGIIRADRSGPFPASSIQSRLWFLDQFSHDGTDAYTSGTVMWLRGSVDVGALARTLDTIVERHEVLRTLVYMDDDGNMLQRIEPPGRCPLTVLPIAESEVASFRARFSNEKLDIARVPLLRVTLLESGPGQCVLLIKVHDIAYDGWSGSVLVKELNTLYRAYCQGESNPLPPLQVQYADYSQWKSRRLSPEEAARQLQYWQRQLEGVADLLTWPTDRARAAGQSFRGADVCRLFPLSLLDGLRALACGEGVTLFAVLMSAFNVLLWTFTGQYDIPIGTLTFDRVMPGLEELIGALLNTVVFRTKLDPSASFREFLHRVEATARAAYKNQDVPFEQVVQAVKQTRAFSYSPLFQVMFAMQNTPREPIDLWELELVKEEPLTQGARFDLFLRTTEPGDGLGVWLEYNVDLFEKETIERLAELFQELLALIVSDPDRSLLQLAAIRAPGATDTP